MYQIYNEDCLIGMKEIPDCSVDMILTDLPYNIVDCAWDKKKIDLSAMWGEFNRILKPYRAACLFASSKFSHKLIASNYDNFKYKWYWVKNAPSFFTHAKNAPMHKVEEILVFSDGAINHASCSKRRMTYNPQGLIPCKATTRTKKVVRGESEFSIHNQNRRKFGSVFGARPSHKETYLQEFTGYPSDVLTFDVATHKVHPTQKPVPLLEYLIKTYTQEGETVLDATMGSGSTGCAAINTNRRFIGFETDEKFYDIAEKRIEQAIADKEQSLF